MRRSPEDRDQELPPYRSAIAKAKNASMGADNLMFFSLLPTHLPIERRDDHAVVNTYEPKMIENPRHLRSVDGVSLSSPISQSG